MKLKALRINKNTVIYVSKEKCNEEYAERYRAKISGNPNIVYGGASKGTVSQEELDEMIKMHKSRRTYKDISARFGYSITKIRDLINGRN